MPDASPSAVPGTNPPVASLLFRPASFFEPLRFAEMFRSDQPLEIELGCGDGTFLVEEARAHPEHNFLGIERLLGRIRKIDRKGRRAGLTNLRALRIEASYFMEYLLPSQSVWALHVYFPDPWPKRRHLKNRLINDRFPELAQRALRPRGRVYLRTDNESYFAQMRSVFAAARAFVPVETPAALADLRTDFERDFQARGIATLRAAYERTELG